MQARDFPPSNQAEAQHKAHQEILAELLPVRRCRENPRVIKRKMSNWPVKRAHHNNWPSPQKTAERIV